MRTARRTATALVMAGILVTGMSACGGDDDDTAAEDTGDGTSSDGSGLDSSATTAASALASPDFCEGFHNLDTAFANAPEDPAAMESFLADEVTPNVALIEANVPTEISGGIETMLGAVEQVQSTGDTSAFESPEFMAAQGEVYPYLAEGCGWQPLEVSGVDFAFEGVPTELEAGMTAVTFTNDSASGEIHEIALLKLADDADITLDELLALPQEEAEQYLDPEVPPAFAFALPGQTGGVTTELVPGEYVYACFIPTGTTMEAEGTGAPHFMEGMAGELTVT